MKASRKRTKKAGASKRGPGKFDLEAIQRYRRVVDYLAAAQIYLKANPLLREPLKPEHVKDRLLGHWGTCPGINLVYAHLNRLILDTDASILLITGPGHGAAANLANMYLEGTLAEFFPGLTRDLVGLDTFIRRFSWPDGFPSHLSPGLPGVIHEGGELGYALATALVLFNPATNLTLERIRGLLGRRFSPEFRDNTELLRLLSPALHLKEDSPPAILLHGSEDMLLNHGLEFMAAAGKLNHRSEFYMVAGQGHGFFKSSPWIERTTRRVDEFLISLGYLQGPPTMQEGQLAERYPPRTAPPREFPER